MPGSAAAGFREQALGGRHGGGHDLGSREPARQSGCLSRPHRGELRAGVPQAGGEGHLGRVGRSCAPIAAVVRLRSVRAGRPVKARVIVVRSASALASASR